MNRRFVTIGGLVLLALAVLGILVACSARKPAVPAPTVQPTASLDPLAQDRQLVEKLSGELGAKYLTYDRPDSNNYLASIKPYLTSEFFQETVRVNQKYASLPGSVSATKSLLRQVEVTDITDKTATATVGLETTERDQKYRQDLEIQWQKLDGRWQAASITISSSDKGQTTSPEPAG